MTRNQHSRWKRGNIRYPKGQGERVLCPCADGHYARGQQKELLLQVMNTDLSAHREAKGWRNGARISR